MYLFDASAIGLAGALRRPSQKIIENQASVSLGAGGGFGSAEVRKFDFKGIVSFRRAFAETSGDYNRDRQTYETLARVTVERLNVLDVISADKIVARLSSSYSDQDLEPRILSAGSYFENLRILGEPVRAELATRFFDENDTFSKLESDAKRLPHDRFRFWHSRDPRAERAYLVSLIEKVDLPSAVKLRRGGSIIDIADFGRIYLAEFLIQPYRRQLNMIRLELGSPVAGSLVIASVSCNGLGGDSGKDDD